MEFTDRYIQLEENSINYRAENNLKTDFMGTLSRFITMEKDLNWEEDKKLYNYFKALNFADISHRPRAHCFDKCVSDVQAVDVSSKEKNCMRECYMKRYTSRDDFQHFILEKMATSQQERNRHMLV